jgi:tetratricopeptide (TPR) repeat protein
MSRKACQMVTEVDENGHETFIPRERWGQEFLKPALLKTWNVPDQLHHLLLDCLERRLYDEMLPIADRLCTLEGWTERAFIMWVACRTETARYAEAEAACHTRLAQHPADAVTLGILAQICERSGRSQEVLEWLWKSLRADPNHLLHATQWINTHRKRGGPAAVDKAFAQLASLPNSWLATLWSQSETLEAGKVEEALAVFREVLSRSNGAPTALAVISGELGVNGFPEELVQLIAPLYDPTSGDLVTGLNLLKAYLDLGDTDHFDRLRARIEAVAPSLREGPTNLFPQDKESARN